MEKCPKCANKGWTPAEDSSVVLKNIKKVKHRNFAIRYYVCLNCGYRFKTIEQFHEEVKPPPSLFDTKK